MITHHSRPGTLRNPLHIAVDSIVFVFKLLVLLLAGLLISYLVYDAYRIQQGVNTNHQINLSRYLPDLNTLRQSLLERINGSPPPVSDSTAKPDSAIVQVAALSQPSEPVEPELAAIPPASIVHDEQWVLSQADDGYVLQVHTGVAISELREHALSLPSNNLVAIYPLARLGTGQILYGLSVGFYASYRDAMDGFRKLPSEFAQSEPWVRPIGDLQAAVRAL